MQRHRNKTKTTSRARIKPRSTPQKPNISNNGTLLQGLKNPLQTTSTPYSLLHTRATPKVSITPTYNTSNTSRFTSIPPPTLKFPTSTNRQTNYHVQSNESTFTSTKRYISSFLPSKLPSFFQPSSHTTTPAIPLTSTYNKRHMQSLASQSTDTSSSSSKPRILTTSIPSSKSKPTSEPLSTPSPAATADATTDTTSQSTPTPTPRARRVLKAAVTVTPSASNRIKFLCDQQESPAKGIRLGVRTRGCNGMSYTMNFADAPQNKFDETVSIPETDIKLFVDNKALLHVIGTTMDYVETDVSAEFVFNNPNSKGSCGCGESFTT